MCDLFDILHVCHIVILETRDFTQCNLSPTVKLKETINTKNTCIFWKVYCVGKENQSDLQPQAVTIIMYIMWLWFSLPLIGNRTINIPEIIHCVHNSLSFVVSIIHFCCTLVTPCTNILNVSSE